jgi:ADP-glucose pyrophosphorylase
MGKLKTSHGGKRGFHFKCIDDFQETELFQKLEESTAVNLNNSSSSSPLKHWLKLMKTPFVSDFYFTKIKTIDCFKEKQIELFSYRDQLSIVHKNPIYTPPKYSIS